MHITEYQFPPIRKRNSITLIGAVSGLRLLLVRQSIQKNTILTLGVMKERQQQSQQSSTHICAVICLVLLPGTKYNFSRADAQVHAQPQIPPRPLHLVPLDRLSSNRSRRAAPKAYHTSRPSTKQTTPPRYYL